MLPVLPVPTSVTSRGAPGQLRRRDAQGVDTVPTRVGWKPTLNATLSFGASIVGNFGLSIENGVLMFGGSSTSGVGLQFWITTRCPLIANRWTMTSPKLSAGGAIAPPLLMKRAVSCGRRPSDCLRHRCASISVSETVAAARCRFGVTVTTAAPEATSACGYTAGVTNASSNGDGACPSTGASSPIVPVPVDRRPRFDEAVG